MMPSAGGVFLGVVKRRNSMITDATSPASSASTEATHASNSLVKGALPDYAMTLGHMLPRCTHGHIETRTSGTEHLFRNIAVRRAREVLPVCDHHPGTRRDVNQVVEAERLKPGNSQTGQTTGAIMVRQQPAASVCSVLKDAAT
jgi:hypothetical protein